jgi:hypothetical protein
MYTIHLILLGAVFMLFSGVIFDGEELHYLERGTTDEGGGGEDDGGEENGITALHFLYRHSDVQTNQTCGKEAVYECTILVLRVVVIRAACNTSKNSCLQLPSIYYNLLNCVIKNFAKDSGMF